MLLDLEKQQTVRVRLLSEPCLWCWEIRDEANSELIESSWTSEWTAYASRREALEAGEARLAQLVLRKGIAKAPAVRGETQRIEREAHPAGRAS